MKPPSFSGLVTEGTPSSWQVTSPDGVYRYLLGRAWDEEPRDGEWDAMRPVFSITMLNPSKASHEIDDPTIRKVIHYAKQEGCGQLLVRNLFAFRATDPAELMKVADPVGPRNLELFALDPFFAVRVNAWGAFKWKRLRTKSIYTRSASHGRNRHVLGLTANGEPRHPLYLPNAARAVLWSAASKG